MPEGDTIYRTASRLRPLLEGRRISAAESRLAALAAATLVGQTVITVESRGKHLLIHFDDRRVLHSHLGMHGSWHVYRPGEPWHKPRAWAALVLETADAICACFRPQTLELLSDTGFRRHPYLHRLGPDLLGQQLDEATVLARFRVHNATPIGQAVMNQTIVCGIGNVYKSEVLFMTRVDPFAPVGRLGDETILQIVHRAAELLSRNLGGQRRRTRPSLDGQRLWVYGRNGQPCFSCGEPIRVRRQGDLGRTTYWCPKCQSETRNDES